MHVLFDIGHPAHVHLFRNARKILIERGHDVHMVAREKEVTHQLLAAYDIPFAAGSKMRKGWRRCLELFEWFWIIKKQIKHCKADIVVSIGSVSAAWAAKLKGIPHLAFNDTETATKQRALYMPATTRIFTPGCCLDDYGKKQERYDGLHDLAYLRPEQFTPSPDIKKELGIADDEKYVLFRFVSWDAIHDWGKGTENEAFKRELIKTASEKARVIISAEGPLPEDLEKLRMKIPPHKLHDAMAFAAAVVGDGSTTATEAAVLGVPSLYISTFADSFGYIKFLKSYKLVDAVTTLEEGKKKLCEILQNPELEKRARRREKMLNETIDVAAHIADMCEKHVIK
jgi:uncharacterized protein